jgi:ribonuclease HI
MNSIQILHLNVGKRRAAQNSLLNDKTLQDFSAIAVVEPYIFVKPEDNVPTIPQDYRWQIYQPTTRNNNALPRHSFRSAIWVNAKNRATQIAVDSYDITAVILHTDERHILVISCYEPRDGTTNEEKEDALRTRTDKMKEAITNARNESGNDTDILVCADLNRYHPIWGGQDTLQHRDRVKEGDQVVSFMHEAGLQSLLRQGTITWEHASRDFQSTIDLILGSGGIQERLTSCTIHKTDHGSDHKAIATRLDYSTSGFPFRKGKRQYIDADWDKIRARLIVALNHTPIRERTGTPEELDKTAEDFTTIIHETLEALVPRARQSPYNKRWWTKELTELRTEYTTRRNRITTLRRRGEDTERARNLANAARRTFHNAIEQQKQNHWKEFLDNADNVWKAAKYAKKKESSTPIPDLTVGDDKVTSDLGKAEVLMDTFFPQPPEAEDGSSEPRLIGRTPKWSELTIYEVEGAIFKSSKDKAPGPDEITFRVWRELWTVVGPHILWMYKTSLETGHIPGTWKTVKIVVLRKPGKADYTIPKAFRPISLIPTLSKGLEAVMAARLSYIAEKYNLLPENHFGARPKRSAEQALNVVVERIYQAWRRQKILTLVSFDVKGAFNGVHAHVLERRLRSRRVPDQATKWIRNFCSQRKAQVALGNYESEPKEIEYPGIPQGSPLSPLLYIFYNADLVEKEIDKTGGAIGFVDDFNAWVVGDNEEQTTSLIQATIIPHAEQWAKQSGAIFEADKTSLIHFTRRKTQEDTIPLLYGGNEILPQASVKVLGVTLDKGLTMQEHVTRMSNKATYAAIALRSIQGVRPAQMRQLYRSCVLPILDYAASTWYGPGRRGNRKLIKSLEKVQRLGARYILRAWKNVSLPVLEAEAHLEDTETRLEKKVTKHTLKAFTLPTTHPVWKACTHKAKFRVVSPMAAVINEHKERVRPTGNTPLQPIMAWTKPPWVSFSNRVEIQERDKALETARLLTLMDIPVMYTDAARGPRLAGCAVILSRGKGLTTIYKESIGWASTTSVLGTELTAIAEGLEYAKRTFNDTHLVVVTDSQHALSAIAQGTGTGSKRVQIARIILLLKQLDEKEVHTNFRWVPARAGVLGNEEADRVAKDISQRPGAPTRPKGKRQREMEGVVTLIHRDIEERRQNKPTEKSPGQHTWRIDKALPGQHTLQLYGALSSDQTATLIQARTGHCRLNKSLYQKNLRESALCGCGKGDETIDHVLLTCPRWAADRKILRDTVGDRCNDVPFLLGGYGTRKEGQSDRLLDGKREKWKPDVKVVKATIEFLQKTGRLEYSRTQEE